MEYYVISYSQDEGQDRNGIEQTCCHDFPAASKLRIAIEENTTRKAYVAIKLDFNDMYGESQSMLVGLDDIWNWQLPDKPQKPFVGIPRAAAKA